MEVTQNNLSSYGKGEGNPGYKLKCPLSKPLNSASGSSGVKKTNFIWTERIQCPSCDTQPSARVARHEASTQTWLTHLSDTTHHVWDHDSVGKKQCPLQKSPHSVNMFPALPKSRAAEGLRETGQEERRRAGGSHRSKLYQVQQSWHLRKVK